MGEYMIVGGIIVLALVFTVRHFLSIRKGGGCGCGHCSCDGISGKNTRPNCCNK